MSWPVRFTTTSPTRSVSGVGSAGLWGFPGGPVPGFVPLC